MSHKVDLDKVAMLLNDAASREEANLEKIAELEEVIRTMTATESDSKSHINTIVASAVDSDPENIEKIAFYAEDADEPWSQEMGAVAEEMPSMGESGTEKFNAWMNNV